MRTGYMYHYPVSFCGMGRTSGRLARHRAAMVRSTLFSRGILYTDDDTMLNSVNYSTAYSSKPTPSAAFNQNARIGADQTQHDLRSTRTLAARTTNYYADPRDRVAFMLNAGVTGGNGRALGNGLDAVAVDQESALRAPNVRKTDDDLMLQQRMFLTVPNLSRGSVNPDDESSLRRGEYLRDRKTGQPLPSTTALRLPEFFPLSLPREPTEEDAMGLTGWKHGGNISRASATNKP